jgi:hypothetical protein
MPASRTRKKKATKKRAKRKVVGARSAESGQFVDKEKLETEPATTVAVTREVEPAKIEESGEDGAL